MSTTIMMPQAIDLALNEMVSDAMKQAISKLSAKYGFDTDEATRFLELDSVKIARKRGPPVKKEKKVKDPNAPKRAKTAYLLFCDSLRSEVKADNPELSPQDVVRALAKQWKALDQDVRDDWKTKTSVVSNAEKDSVSDTDSD